MEVETAPVLLVRQETKQEEIKENSDQYEKDDLLKETVLEATILDDGVVVEVQDDLKYLLKEFYQKYNPEKLNNLDVILTKFQGKEDLLVQQLKEKYGADADSLHRFVTNNITPKLNSTNGSNHNSDDSQPQKADDVMTKGNLVNNSPISISTPPVPSLLPPSTTSNSNSSNNSISTTISAGVQDISTNLAASLLGWQKSNSTVNNNINRKDMDSFSSTSTNASNGSNNSSNTSSSAVGDALLVRLNTLQTELKLKEDENTKLQISPC